MLIGHRSVLSTFGRSVLF